MQTGLQLCSFVIDIVLVVGFRSPTLEVETGTPPLGTHLCTDVQSLVSAVFSLTNCFLHSDSSLKFT